MEIAGELSSTLKQLRRQKYGQLGFSATITSPPSHRRVRSSPRVGANCPEPGIAVLIYEVTKEKTWDCQSPLLYFFLLLPDFFCYLWIFTFLILFWLIVLLLFQSLFLFRLNFHCFSKYPIGKFSDLDYQSSKILGPRFYAIDALDLAPRLLGNFLRMNDVVLYITENCQSSRKMLKNTVEEVKDANDRTAHHFAARECKTDVCQYLVEELKLDVNVKDIEG